MAYPSERDVDAHGYTGSFATCLDWLEAHNYLVLRVCNPWLWLPNVHTDGGWSQHIWDVRATLAISQVWQAPAAVVLYDHMAAVLRAAVRLEEPWVTCAEIWKSSQKSPSDMLATYQKSREEGERRDG